MEPATWRERMWTAIFEEGRTALAAAETTLLAGELGLELSADDLVDEKQRARERH